MAQIRSCRVEDEFQQSWGGLKRGTGRDWHEFECWLADEEGDLAIFSSLLLAKAKVLRQERAGVI